ncbi:hypothetical protein A2841_00240 [Candidatus Kaiserbacteria bacterium RIFCSPHIGHO2_01_FULL_48_10]|uniref:EamA domain-containing protein n=1 Tax=Candidatus Kaiserbacteria bacterium RIFCSPHIGHO2_01_FULL_48_10 TaxID=1798476 RepID=A0A1F6C1R6_9BACT|nr:MAG: hypothetical protein A2841_00240 [Candidatus Kaiserbacteria bacterium RIFCSPHIGHO2_01_FULL_48_10]
MFLFGIFLSLATACIESGKDIYLSSGKTRHLPHLLRVFFLPLLSLPLVGAVVLYRGIPVIEEAFWLYTSTHALLMVFANYCYMRALAAGSVSETQPMLALTTVFLIITTPLLTDDSVTLIGWSGVLLVALGIYATQHPGRNPETGVAPSFWEPFFHMWSRPGVLWMFIVAVIYSITSNLDKLSVLAADGPTYLLVDYTLTAFLTILLIGIGISIRVIPHGSFIGGGNTLITLAPGGVLNATSSLVQMWALTFLPVPYVIAIKRLSIVMASLWGYFMRRERAPHWFRILGVLLVFGGIFIILVFGRI